KAMLFMTNQAATTMPRTRPACPDCQVCEETFHQGQTDVLRRKRAHDVTMLKSWRLGTILGFPVELNLSFILLLALVFVAFGGFAGVILMLLVFGSVLLHELGHAVVARKLGFRVSGIELSFSGGAAKMIELPRTATHELWI